MPHHGHGRGGHRSTGKANAEKRGEENTIVDENCPVIQQFRNYQQQLDRRHDKHERIVKLSRDVTIDSKRAIFLLHRINGENREQILADTEAKLEELQQQKWKLIATELENEDPYQFLRAYYPGLQEYIEAISFYQYLKDKSLANLESIESRLKFNKVSDPDDQSDAAIPAPVCTTLAVTVPPVEYLLGIADLTGELMRMAIHSVGSGDLDRPLETCAFLRQIHDAFIAFGNTSREITRKVHVLKQSLQKVETVCYTLQVRGSEVPKHMLADMISGRQQKDTDNCEEDITASDY